MPKFAVQKSILIDASPEAVFEKISHFKHWITWSPWHILEPDSKWEVSEDGTYYSWEGKRLGSGNMTITEARPNSFLGYRLQFLKPHKSVSNDNFTLEETHEGTMVTWNMHSSLPFFLFFLVKFMEAAIGMDFVRGLNMLKDYVETGSVPSQLTFQGETLLKGFSWVGKKNSCKLKEVGPIMENDYKELEAWFAKRESLVAGPPVAFYPKMEVVSQQMTFVSALPVNEIPADLPEGWESGTVSDMKTWVIVHKGPYKHLGNPWSALSSIGRSKTARFSKKQAPFERYLNDPRATPEHELLTELHFPLK